MSSDFVDNDLDKGEENEDSCANGSNNETVGTDLRNFPSFIAIVLTVSIGAVGEGLGEIWVLDILGNGWVAGVEEGAVITVIVSLVELSLEVTRVDEAF